MMTASSAVGTQQSIEETTRKLGMNTLGGDWWVVAVSGYCRNPSFITLAIWPIGRG
jgi:hypothetical protein